MEMMAGRAPASLVPSGATKGEAQAWIDRHLGEQLPHS